MIKMNYFIKISDILHGNYRGMWPTNKELNEVEGEFKTIDCIVLENREII